VGGRGRLAACSVRVCAKLIPAPVWVSPTKKQLGKPRVWKPWNVRMPRRQYSDSRVPPRPTRSTPTEVSMSRVSKPVAKTRQSGGYSTPPATTPSAVIFSMPRPAVATRVTVGRLNAARCSSWKPGRLHMIR